MAAAAIKKNIDIMVVGVIFYSVFLDIDGQSLRLRGPAINWWLFLGLSCSLLKYIMAHFIKVFKKLRKIFLLLLLSKAESRWKWYVPLIFDLNLARWK